jgi:ABC-type xylose transport system permease subunit
MTHWIAISYLVGLVMGAIIGAWFGFTVASDECEKNHGRSQGSA